MIKPIREITAEEENFRLEAGIVRRDPVKPVPVGTIVLIPLRVTGYDPDCDGSLMGRMEYIDRYGKSSGGEIDSIGMHSSCTLVVDSEEELKELFDG